VGRLALRAVRPSAGPLRLLRRAPKAAINAATPVLVQATINLATAILFESALSFLGLGTQPPYPSLGLMVSEGRNYLEVSPWPTLGPGLAIVVAVLGINLLGDALQELLDPRLRPTWTAA
jgi:peptide/nickel transport system permease protein